MARWESNAVGRLREAAMELYREPGYDKVTVAEIAARAGLTPRTFFRYFPDKREVLFTGAAIVEKFLTDGIAAAAAGTPALEAVAGALAQVSRLSEEDAAHAEFVRQRHAVIQGFAELRERELGKHAALVATAAVALGRRGVRDPAATLAAEAALAAFKVGFERWIDDPKRRKMALHIDEAMKALGTVVAGAVVVDPATPRATTAGVDSSPAKAPAKVKRR